MRHIEFTTQDHKILRGWFFVPKKTPAPAIIMTHGFSALKEHGLQAYAEVFQKAGFCVLVYDHRNFGESEGDPRLEVNPEKQIQDLQDAITFLTSLEVVNASKIGLWGNSFSGGHAIVLSAIDERIKCSVSQVPFMIGHHTYLEKNSPAQYKALQKKYKKDQKRRAEGEPPIMLDVVSLDENKSVIMQGRDAYEFFTKIPSWINQVTLHSMENAGNYSPMHYISKVHAPTLMIVAEDDKICPAKFSREAYEKINQDKKLITIFGGHFSPFQNNFSKCVAANLSWYKKYL